MDCWVFACEHPSKQKGPIVYNDSSSKVVHASYVYSQVRAQVYDALSLGVCWAILREVEARLEQSLLEEMRILDTEKEELRMMKERFLKEKKVLKHLGFS